MRVILRHLMLGCCAAAGIGAWAEAASARAVFVVTGREGDAEATPDIARVLGFWREQGADATQVDAGALDDPPAGGAASGTDRVIYYSGPIGRGERGLILADRSGPVAAAVPVEGVLEAGGDRGPTTLVINHCGTNMNISPRDFGFGGDWIVAYPVSSNCVAETVASRTLAALSGPREGWVGALQAAGMMVARPPAPGGVTAGEGPRLQAVRNDSIVITTLRPSLAESPRIAGRAPEGAGGGSVALAAAAPRELPAGAVTPPAMPSGTASVTPSETGAAPLVEGGGDRLVQPLRAGLPRPSIIVGEQALRPPEGDPPEDPQPEAPPRDASGVAYALRATMRREDAEGFARLLALGAFDPDADQVARAIQTELQRMSCYGSTVDGIWGRGSTTAVERYFAAASQPVPSRTPDVALYRAIISGPDLNCPAPVAAPVAPRNTSAQPAGSGRGGTTASRPRNVQTGGGQTSTGQTTRRPRAEQPSQPQAPTNRTRPRIDPGFGGSGMFR